MEIRLNRKLYKASALSIVSMLCLVSFGQVSAQTDSVQLKKEKRLEKRAVNDENRKKSLAASLKMVSSREFVITVNRMYDRHNNFFLLDPVVNFLRVDKEEATIQLSLIGLAGWNGVGGITLKGKLDNYKVFEPTERGVINVNMQIRTASAGFPAAYISIYSDGMARMELTNNSGDSFYVLGRIFDPNEIFTIQGSPSY